MRKYIITTSEGTHGPFSEEQVRVLAMTGKLRPSDQVRFQGGTDFRCAREIRGFISPSERSGTAAPSGLDAQSLYDLGLRYLHGRGVAACAESAIDCFRRASSSGHVDAMYRLGACLSGRPSSASDQCGSPEVWLKKAASAGHVQARQLLDRRADEFFEDGMRQMQHGDANTNAIATLKRAADNGHVDAMYQIGSFYAQRVGGYARNARAAYEWMRMAAAAGHADARDYVERYGTTGEAHIPSGFAIRKDRTAHLRNSSRIGAKKSSGLGILGWIAAVYICGKIAVGFMGRDSRGGHLPAAGPFEVWVDPHSRNDGTQVRGHYRTSPDATKSNNWSQYPNTNPHTGERGSRRN